MVNLHSQSHYAAHTSSVVLFLSIYEPQGSEKLAKKLAAQQLPGFPVIISSGSRDPAVVSSAERARNFFFASVLDIEYLNIER
jgi:predicted esterase